MYNRTEANRAEAFVDQAGGSFVHVATTFGTNFFLPFFEKLAKEVRVQNKEALVIDPAHDNAFLWVRGIPYGMVGAGAAAVGKGLWDRLRTSRISRRQSLVNLGLGALGLAVAGSGYAIGSRTSIQEKNSQSPITRFSETDFRRTVVAKGIVQLGEESNSEQVDRKKKILVVYPPVHWEGLKGLLQDRGNLDKKFQSYSLI